MTAAVSLFDLPTELLIRIFCDLNSSDLVSCQLTHSSLCNIITESVVLSYRKALDSAGFEDSPHSKIIISERLALLNAQENAWLNIRPNFKQIVKINHSPSGIYDVTGGIYLLGDRTRRALHYVTLPTEPSDVARWNKIDLGQNIIDMALAIYEHDLIAIVTTIPQPHQESASHIIELVLLKFSTGEPHPSARHSRLFVANSEWARPAINMEISGDNLALIVTHFLPNHLPQDRFYVYEWKTGVLKMEIIAPGGCYGGLVFLSPQILLLPNAAENVFEFWHVPSTAETAPTSPIGALGLPPFKEGHFISMLSCRGEPNPVTGGLPYSTRPYHPSAMDAIIIFNLRVQGMGVVVPWNSFSIFAHRRALLKLCLDITSPLTDGNVPLIPWAQWGPSITRWLGGGVLPTRWITTTSGQRCVFRLARSGDEPSSPIVVFDFNPTSVKRAAVAEASSRRIACVPGPTEIIHRSFEAPIVSALPYACYVSPDVFDYDGLLMDEERLIGLQTDVHDRIASLEVLHFG